jgi:hypothetical protein
MIIFRLINRMKDSNGLLHYHMLSDYLFSKIIRWFLPRIQQTSIPTIQTILQICCQWSCMMNTIIYLNNYFKFLIIYPFSDISATSSAVHIPGFHSKTDIVYEDLLDNAFPSFEIFLLLSIST